METHNYTASSGEFKSRLLATNEKEDIEVFLDLCVDTKSVKSFVREKRGKDIQTKDTNNIKMQTMNEKQDRLSKCVIYWKCS